MAGNVKSFSFLQLQWRITIPGSVNVQFQIRFVFAGTLLISRTNTIEMLSLIWRRRRLPTLVLSHPIVVQIFFVLCQHYVFHQFVELELAVLRVLVLVNK